MMPDPRHYGGETEPSLGLKQASLGASANVPSPLTYCSFILISTSPGADETASERPHLPHPPHPHPCSSTFCQWSS